MTLRPAAHPVPPLLGKTVALLAYLLLSGPLPAGHAQITTNITPTTGAGNLGTVVTPAGSVHTITGGTRASTNLFHSFGLFSVGAGDIANFSNNTGLATTNIISRVTGGSLSNIFGTIQTTGFGSANLFLLNPAGVVFGPGASLNLGGSFHVSTADYLRMSDGVNSGNFYADPAKDGATGSVLLSVSPLDFGFLTPSAFGFTSSAPASITIQGSFLQVPTGKTLSAVGGDITMTGGTLSAPSGTINIASVASAGEVLHSTLGYGPNVNGDSFGALGTITIGNSSTTTTLDAQGNPGGSVVIRGGQLTLEKTDVLVSTTTLNGAAKAIDIQVTGDALVTNSTLSSLTSSAGTGGAIDIQAGNLTIANGSSVRTVADSSDVDAYVGRSGDIRLTASSLSVNDSGTTVQTFAGAVEAGGDITILSNTIALAGSAMIATSAYNLEGGSRISISPADPLSPLSVTGTGSIRTFASGTVAGDVILQAGSGGEIAIVSPTSMVLQGASDSSSLFISTSASSAATAGPLTFTAPAISMSNMTAQSDAGGIFGWPAGTIQITTDSLSLSRATIASNGSSAVNADGFPGGSINIAPLGTSLTVSNATLFTGSIQSNAGATGPGGGITMTAPASLTLNGPIQVVAGTTTAGNAGAVSLTAPTISLGNGVTVFSNTSGAGHGGDLRVTAGILQIDGPDVSFFIFTRTDGFGGLAGNVLLNAGQIVLPPPPPTTMQNITLDGSLTLGGPLTLTGPDYVIGAELGQIRGSNLFHSFGVFNVFAGESATFTGPNLIANILARVTGGEQSFIDGILRTTIPGANLYLLNPSGVLFGQNARLDVGGSFHVSTADYVRMFDGINSGKFYVDVTKDSAPDSVLSTVPPVTFATLTPQAFGFLGPNPAAITIEGSILQVPIGQSLSFVGGDITMTGGTLTAPSGTVGLASTASPGEYLTSTFATNPNINGESFTSQGTISLSSSATVDTSGNPGGSTVIRGGQLTLDSSTIKADTTGSSNGATTGIDVQVAGAVTLANNAMLSTGATSSGNAGGIAVSADSLTLNSGSQIKTTTTNAGNAGFIALTAPAITFSNGSAAAFSTTSGSGNGGNIEIATDILTIASIFTETSSLFSDAGRGGNISIAPVSATFNSTGVWIQSASLGAGPGGDITISASDSITLSSSSVHSGASFTGTGRGGSISFAAPNINLNASANISSSSGGAAGGTVTVTAPTSLTIAGGIDSSTDGLSPAGNIVISSPLITFAGGTISSRSARGGDFGSIGQISITTPGNTLNIAGAGAIRTIAEADAAGGAITLSAPNSIVLQGSDSIAPPASPVGPGHLPGELFQNLPTVLYITSDARSTGNAGSVTLTAPAISIGSGVVVSSSTTALGNQGGGLLAGMGGTVSITAGTSLSISGPLTLISADTYSTGAGGNLVIQAGQFTLADGALVSAGSASFGHAGNISISASMLDITGGAQITTATVSAGAGGAIPMSGGNAGTVSISGGSLTLSSGAQIKSDTTGSGNAGTITITETGAVTLAGSGSTITTSTTSSGNAGNVSVTAGSFSLSNGAQITSSTSGAGAGGDVTLTASDTVSIAGGQADPTFSFFAPTSISSQTFSNGNAGAVSISGRTVEIKDGAQINTSTNHTYDINGQIIVNSGRGGDVTIVASDTVSIAGGQTDPAGLFIPAGIFSSSSSNGNAGAVSISGATISLTEGQINTNTFAYYDAAGNVILNTGRGGDISLTATGAISLGRRSGLSSTTTSNGNAGQIFVSGSTISLTEGQINTSTFSYYDAAGNVILNTGRGGDITIHATEAVSIDTYFGGIFGRSEGDGDSGRLSLSTNALNMNGGRIDFSAFRASRAGDITITAKNIQMTNQASISAGADIVGTGQSGDVTITTDSLQMSGLSTINTHVGNGPRGGNVTIKAGDIQMSQANIDAATSGTSRGGDVTIIADRLHLIGLGTGIHTGSNAVLSDPSTHAGDGGTVSVSVRTLDLLGGAVIDSTFGGRIGTIGRAGDVTITATDSISLSGGVQDLGSIGHAGGIFTQSLSDGTAGTISVSTRSLTMTGGGQINSSTGGAGQGGDIIITASESVSLSGSVPGNPHFLTSPSSGLFSRTTGSGNAGKISVTTGSLDLSSGARIDTTTQGSDAFKIVSPDGTILFQPTFQPTGRGGDIAIAASSVSISGPGSGLFSNSEPGSFSTLTFDPNLNTYTNITSTPATSGVGRGGDIRVGAGNITLDGGATISAKSSTDGQAGNIFLKASDALLMHNSSITTESALSDGGNIDIQAVNMVHLIDSEITAHAAGSGGNISIDPLFVILNGSKIIASAIAGAGGNINIVAGTFLISPNSVLDASSSLGVSGSINISSPTTNLSGTLAPLPEDFLQAAGLLRGRCAARAGGKASSFVMGGRDGVPLEPGGMMSSPLYQAGSAAPSPAARTAGAGLRIGGASLRASSSRHASDVSPAGLGRGCAS